MKWKPELIVYDFDGVMTDDKVLVLSVADERDANTDFEGVWCNRKDGWAVGLFRKEGIPQIILTSEAHPITWVRGNKLGLDVFRSNDKGAYLQGYCGMNNISLKQVVMVGNGLNDLDALERVGHPFCPVDSHPTVLKYVRKRKEGIVLLKQGGDGVLLELWNRLNGQW